MSSLSFFHCRAAGLGLLAAASIFAAPAAQAQGLVLDPDSQAIGSATISGSGTTVSGNYAFSGGAGSKTTSYSTVGAFATLSGNPSAVTLQTGGSVSTLSVFASTLTMSGGSVGSLILKDAPGSSSGQTFPSAGSITGGSVQALSITGGYDQLFGQPPTSVFATCTLSGGTFGTLASSFNGGYNILGTNLHYYTNGLVTGTLSDGQMLDAQYTQSSDQGYSGFLDFNGVAAVPQAPPPAVPEASTTVSFGLLLLLGAGGLALAKRRRTVTAPSV